MSTRNEFEHELVRVIFEAGGNVNLAETLGSYGDGEYYSVNVGDRDFNTEEEFLPEYLTEKLALLKLSPPNSHIVGVGFKNNTGPSAYEMIFSVCSEVFYVDISSVGFKGLIAGCKVRRSNREVK
jgi:hypothetical protein